MLRHLPVAIRCRWLKRILAGIGGVSPLNRWAREVAWFALACTLLSCASASAQVIVIDNARHILPPRPPVPRPTPIPSAYKIRTVDVQGTIRDQAAKIQISQVFQNIGSTTLEAQFIFPMPENAAISGLTLLVDGKELTGKLLKKEEARRIYEETVRRQRDPALLEYMGQGLFQSSVFPIPPQAERTVEIRYTQLLKKENGLIDLLLPIGTTKHSNHPVETMNITLRVEAADQIKTIYSPTHALDIQRPDNNHAVCKLTLRDAFSPNDFRLFFGTVNGLVGTNIISYRPNADEEGYFLLLASPEVAGATTRRVDKSLIFAFDKSGSMSGKKMEQAKEALRFLIRQLQPGDTFNVVAYDSTVETFRPELQRVDDATITAALGFVDGMYAGGSTNINGALQSSLKMLGDPQRPAYILFMTDGLPTVGEMNEQKIAANAKQANAVNARLFVFGVGYDVNARLLDRLARDQRGQSVYVRPNENIEAHVAALQSKIGSPLLTDLAINVEYDQVIPAGSAAPVSRTYPRQLTDLFQGEQLVWVGRYKYGGAVKVTLTGSAAGEKKSFTLPATLTEKSTDESNGFVEKLWATRRIGEIIDELDLRGQNSELIDELVQLSMRHGIITPYTSFLADENVTLANRAGNTHLGMANVRRSLVMTEGKSGVTQRVFKGGLQNSSRPAATGGAAFEPFARDGSAQSQEAITKFRASGGRSVLAVDAEGELNAIDSLRNVGQKTFFRKNKQWQDSTISAERAQKATNVVQFSDAYFELAASHGGTLAKYLAFEEPVLVDLAGQVYLIVPPAAEGNP
jgi:Ca-activated chloride channel homolog